MTQFPLLNKLLSPISFAYKTYPLAVLFAYIATVAYLVAIFFGSTYVHLGLASSFGFLLMVGLYHWRKKSKVLLLGVLISIGYFLFIHFVDMPDELKIARHATALLVGFLLLLTLPFTGKEGENQKWWAWNLNVALAMLSSAVFSLILFGGLSGALLLVEALFAFDINNLIFLANFILIFGIFMTHYFLSLLKLDEMENIPKPYNRIGDFFVKYILTLTTSVYALILVGYVIKIILTMQWPHGIMAWFSIIFAQFVLLTYLFWTPLGGRYKKLLLTIGLIQLILFFIAISIRVESYGWSSNRYMITLFGLWYMGTFSYFLFAKNIQYRFSFITLIVLLLVAQFGWRINAYDVADQSQANRLTALLQAHPHLSNTSAPEVLSSIISSIKTLESHSNFRLLKEIMPTIVQEYNSIQDENKPQFTVFAVEKLGFDYFYPIARDREVNSNQPISKDWSNENLALNNYDTMIITPNYIINNNLFIVDLSDGTRHTFDLSPLAKPLANYLKNIAELDYPDDSKFIYSAENKQIAIKLHVQNIVINTNTMEVVNIQGILFKRIKE